MKNSFIRGVALLTVATYIVKVIGFIYVIPFVSMVGEENYILFEYAYKPYVIMLMIATLGIPSAVSKFVAKKRETKEYNQIRFLLINGSILMVALGLLSFFVLYYSAEYLAHILVGNQYNMDGNSVEDVIYVIRMVSYALIIVPLLALYRGFIQGYQSMGPTSISQVVEQIIRVTVILVGSYVIIYHLKYDAVIAVGVSTFAAFVGAFFALMIMIYYLFKRNYNLNINRDKPFSKRKVGAELIKYTIPFIFVGSSITIFQTIDTFTINQVLVEKGMTLKDAELINAIISLIQKIIVIPFTIGTALSTSLIAYVSNAYQGGRINEIRENINKSFQILSFFIIPSSFGIIILAKPIYASLFGIEHANTGGDLLTWFGFAPLFFSLYSVTSAILQGMDKLKWINLALILSVAIKLLTIKPLIMIFDGIGTALSTYLSFGVAILLQMYIIKKEGKYNWIENIVSIKRIVTQTIFMVITILPIGIYSIQIESYFHQVILMFVGVSIGSIIYLAVSYKNGMLVKLFPKKKQNKN